MFRDLSIEEYALVTGGYDAGVDGSNQGGGASDGFDGSATQSNQADVLNLQIDPPPSTIQLSCPPGTSAQAGYSPDGSTLQLSCNSGGPNN